ncbi:S-4TM family putative pore-forming effector [Micromonospora sp. NPDC023644]|uniref:S-4TM family putative pore-forming effector n=1 Tax=Micromonospora sp. NPDC023644 TaxID=3154321 RepID=UPI0033EE1932
MSVSRPIARRQNDEPSLTLLRAIAVVHRSTQHAQALSLVLSAVVAALGLLTVAFPAAAAPVALVGAAWAVVYATAIVPWAGRHLRTSATLQEMFDVRLFGLPWNQVAVGDRLSEDEVSRLSRRFRGREERLRDYYLVAALPAPLDVLFCLEQNLAWGSRVRRRFAHLMIAVVVLWCAVGVLLAIAEGSTVVQLISGWLIPSLGLLLLCVDTYRAQMSNTDERTRVLGLLRAVSADAGSPPAVSGPEFVGFARQIQDVLFHIRRQQPRMPSWFFWRFHDSDLADFRFRMRELEAGVGRGDQVARQPSPH